MKLSLKIVRKPKIIFLLSKTFLFFFEESIYFLILGKVAFIIFHFSTELETKKQICLSNAECQGKFQTLLCDLTEPKCHKTKH